METVIQIKASKSLRFVGCYPSISSVTQQKRINFIKIRKKKKNFTTTFSLVKSIFKCYVFDGEESKKKKN